MNIPIIVNGKIATAPDDAKIVCGNSDYTVTFDFDSEWELEAEKTARFIWTSGKRTKYTDTCFTGNTVAVPILTNTYSVRVGVYAGDLHTTSPAKISCLPSILCPDGIEDSSTPMVWTILQKRLDALMKGSSGHLNQEQVEQLIKKHLTGGFVAQPEEPDDKSLLWIDTDEEEDSDDMEQIAILIEADMLPAVHNPDGKILTDETGRIVLRY